MKNIIFIAPPAAGKGSFSDFLVKDYNYEHLSTGDLLRDEINSGSSIGKEISDIMARGELVSDDIIINLVKDKLNSFDKSVPFILDGFPRNLNQAKMLDEMLISLGVTNNVVLYLNVDYDLALKRAVGRLSCPKCKKSYNINFQEMRPQDDNVCDVCKEDLVHRSDDNEESFKVRYNTYLDNVSLIMQYYKDKNILKEIHVDNDFQNCFKKVIEEAKND